MIVLDWLFKDGAKDIFRNTSFCQAFVIPLIIKNALVLIMIFKLKLVPVFFSCFFVLSACNTSEEESSPYEETLIQQPFAPLTDSIKKNSSDPDLYYRRGVILKKNNLTEPALADFQKAWSLRKKEEYAINISNILIAKNHDSAIKFLNEALQTFPSGIFLQRQVSGADT